MSAVAQTTKIKNRSIGSSVRALEPAVAVLGAVALALAFPKYGLAWLAPLGAAGMVWAWQRQSWAGALFTGWLAGTLFFAITFSWFSYTVGSYVGPFAFAIVAVPAFVEGLAFAAAALLTRLAARRAAAWAFPFAAAAGFTVPEALRSAGPLGVPFGQLGYAQVNTPLAIFAAYAGSYGVTFVVMLLGASIAQAVARRSPTRLAAVAAAIAIAWAACYWAWPARHASSPTIRVAAVQGNITQTLKWQPATVRRAIATYLELPARLRPLHPQLTVLPETVIAEVLNADPDLIDRFGKLARTMRTTLVVGSLENAAGRQYNALYTFREDGSLQNIYRKRQLVPFAEAFPGRQWLAWMPNADLIDTLAAGTEDTVVPFDGSSFAPLICWESAFAELVHAQVSSGARLLVIATDDAWFGETSGTYQHAQIAQMRAIENGMWALQSASTGISGVIAPNGSWTERSAIGRTALVVAQVGAPPGSLFARVGPAPVVAILALLYLAVVGFGFLRQS